MSERKAKVVLLAVSIMAGAIGLFMAIKWLIDSGNSEKFLAVLFWIYAFSACLFLANLIIGRTDR